MRQGMARRIGAAALLAGLLLLGGCETRSISDSGYHPPSAGGRNPFYGGELSEFDVLGIDPRMPASDEEIAEQLAKRQKVGLRKGDAMMVIQSGAPLPDDQMVAALDRYFAVVPFTGVPLAERERAGYRPSPAPMVTEERGPNYARVLRLAAARSGSGVIFCYWGLIETAIEREPTKVVSWVPLVGAAVPDETQLMRIRLKVAVIDVRTGQWSMFSPEPAADAALSASLIRAASDQKQVAALKEKVYKAAVEAFIARYAS